MEYNYYFKHDYHARHDPKIEHMQIEMGPVGTGIYWNLIEMLYEEGGRLKLKSLPFIAKSMHTTLQDLEKVVLGSELFVVNGEYFYSEAQLERLKHLVVKRRKAKTSAKSRWGTTVMRTQCERNAIRGDKIRGDKIKGEHSIAVAEAWNESSLPKVRELSKVRKAKLDERLKSKHFQDNYKEAITKLSNSSFAKGNGKTGWRVSLDWFIDNDNNYIKALEGKYDDPHDPMEKYRRL